MCSPREPGLRDLLALGIWGMIGGGIRTGRPSPPGARCPVLSRYVPRMPSDADFLGLTPLDEAGRFHFRVVNHLSRLDGHLYGGTAIAVSIAAAEIVSERPAVWMTTQFVATAPPGAEVHVHAEVLAPGRRTNQVRVTGTSTDGDVMFASTRRDRPPAPGPRRRLREPPGRRPARRLTGVGRTARRTGRAGGHRAPAVPRGRGVQRVDRVP